MTLSELWKLFPITLTPHSECWDVWYDEEKRGLEGLLGGGCRISHIGSTAIAGIMAKPIIDILVELPLEDMDRAKDILTNSGYICMSESYRRKSFNKGYTESGYAERVFHIHVRCFGDNDEIYFRDYLNSHPDTANEYERLKLSLLPKYRNDRDAYTDAKTDFVRKVIATRYVEIT